MARKTLAISMVCLSAVGVSYAQEPFNIPEFNGLAAGIAMLIAMASYFLIRK